jgi:integrase
MAKERSRGEGSLYQRHDHPSCPKVGPDGKRPEHRCRGRWVGAIEVTEGATRRRAAFYGRTKADVKASIKRAQARVDLGAPAKDAKALLSVVVTAWIASTLEASDLKPSTKATYATLLRSQVLTDDIASKPLADLKPGHVEQLTVRMRDKGCSPSTIRQTYTVLRSVLETAVRDELLASNPATKVKRPGVPRTEAHYLSIAEVASLLEATKKSRYAPLLRLLVATGLRRGEALALRWSDVDLTNGLLRVRGTVSRVNGHLLVSEPKTERSRRDVPLSPTTVALLRSVKVSQAAERLKAASIWVETGLVFTTERGTAVDPRNALRAIRTAAKALGMSGVGLHTLRHSFATHMLAAGVPLHTVSELLGHSSVAVTGDVYGHVSTEGARSAVERLSATMGW